MYSSESLLIISKTLTCHQIKPIDMEEFSTCLSEQFTEGGNIVIGDEPLSSFVLFCLNL